ncbi:hypothetical protein [Microlunatus ginsengisoli]|uniref:Uncharacterized protein n=1 Tax=Microlunatus ginsengisoli TaxID=363863 RepID=A0ABP7AWA9_9ACTN
MATDLSSLESLLARAELAWAGGDGPAAMALWERADAVASDGDDLRGRVAAVLGLARSQPYNLSPGTLPIRLRALYDVVDDRALRARLAAALARCWAYANESRRASPLAAEALQLAEQLDEPALLAGALDASLASHWGPDDLALRRDWAIRLGDAAAYLADPDARLQAELWSLTVAWEVLDLPRMHRSIRVIEQLAEESSRAEFFAASRRLPLELLRMNLEVVPALIERAVAAAERAVIPDAAAVLHAMRAFSAVAAGDRAECAAEGPVYEQYAADFGVATVRAEAAVVWLGAGRLDKAAEMIGVFTPAVLADLPRDSDWFLVLQCLLEAALAVGDREVITSVVALLEPYAGRSVVNAGAVAWHGVTDDTLARGYAVLGDADAAERHRDAALATYERIGAVWWRDRLRGEPASGDRARGRTGGVGPRGVGRVGAGAVTVHLHRQPGGLWLVGREGATFVLPQLRGLAHLHTLVGRPDTDVPAIRLGGAAEIRQGSLEVLDDESRRFLAARLAELDAELAEDDRADLREERSAIETYLAGGSGLGGRHRSTGSVDERARVAVRKAIVAALARIAEADPWLGRHLRDRVRTGLQCRYESDRDHPVHWILAGAAEKP